MSLPKLTQCLLKVSLNEHTSTETGQESCQNFIFGYLFLFDT